LKIREILINCQILTKLLTVKLTNLRILKGKSLKIHPI
jgi:hypothetical protein